MSSQVTKMRGSCERSIEELVSILKENISGELVTESWRYAEGCEVVLLIFEKFYLRNASYANLTILLTEIEGYQLADVVGSGGGEGFLNISWGANSNFANAAERILAANGFSS